MCFPAPLLPVEGMDGQRLTVGEEVHREACFPLWQHALTFMLWQDLPILNTQENAANMSKSCPMCDLVNLITVYQHHQTLGHAAQVLQPHFCFVAVNAENI